MSYFDELNYQTLLLIAAAHEPDADAGARAYEAAWDSGVDPIHIAQHLAAMVAPMVPLERVQAELAVAAAAVAAEFSDSGELKYPSPKGRVRKPGRGKLWEPPHP